MDADDSPIFGTESCASLVDVRFVVGIHRSHPNDTCPFIGVIVGNALGNAEVSFDGYEVFGSKIDADYERLVALWKRWRVASWQVGA